MDSMALRATGAVSHRRNGYRIQNPARPRSVYTIPVTNPDPGPDGRVGTSDDPGRTITFYDYPAAYRGGAFEQAQYVNDASTDQNFKSLEVAMTKRLSQRWQLIASYSTTWKHIPLIGTVDDSTSAIGLIADNPNVEINTGDFNREWLLRFTGSYNLSWNMLVSSNYEQRSGIPFARTALFAGGIQVPSLTLNVEPIGAEHYPSIGLWDIGLQKSLTLGSGRTAMVRVTLYNTLNRNTGTTVTAQSGANFNYPSAILPPRIAEFSVSYRF
jgi:hypothetical protein